MENLTQSQTTKQQFIVFIDALQATMCTELEHVDGLAKFRTDAWERPEGGGGVTRIIENGQVFEKGGVNVSKVHGKLSEVMKEKFGIQHDDFFACGISVVLHPKNPYVPTVHSNYRYFEIYDTNKNLVKYWFGGGQDLTPYYYFEEDENHFHQSCKSTCDKYNSKYYEEFSKWCDDYFYNAHRKEHRGIGGLFFDYLSENKERTKQDVFNFVCETGANFLASYLPILKNRKDTPYTQQETDWQEIRRGRYVEFNLIHDRGTLFGLKTNGRVESILMSLPARVQWKYDYHPQPDSAEEQLIQRLTTIKNPT